MLKKFTVSLGAVIVLATVGCSSDDNSGSSAGGSSGDDFCSLLVAFASANDSLGDDVTSGDAGKASTAMKRIVGQVQLLQDKAPADIKGDVDATATFFTEFDQLMAKYGYDLDKLQSDATAVDEFAKMNDSVTAARDQLRAYGESECGVTATSS